MLLDEQTAKLIKEGLVVEGPYQKGSRGWLGRFTIAMGPRKKTGDINFLSPPITWIYKDGGLWFADFRYTFPTADEAVDAVVNYYRSISPGDR